MNDASGAGDLVPLQRYREDVLRRVGPLEPVECDLLEALGCVLAEDITAPAPVPAFANSAMDGYAVRAEDAHEGAELALIGEAAAGASSPPPVGEGQAVRIMTGAPVPPGAGAVVPVEFADESGDLVRVRTAPGRSHIRPAGEDLEAGERVLVAGRRLGPADLGMLATVGRSRVLVRPRPRVAVFSTGDEVVAPDAPLAPGQIRDANSFTLTAQATEAGALAVRHPIVPDDRRALTEAFESVLADADMLLTSGGVSAGRYDLVKQVLADLGDVAFRKVGMKPGMPQAFGVLGGRTGGTACFGLPGNPVSAFVSFEVLVRPALRRMQGRTDLNRPRAFAVLDETVSSPPGKVLFVRVALERRGEVWHARTTGPQGSGILGSVVAADGLAEIPAARTTVEAGERITVHLLADP